MSGPFGKSRPITRLIGMPTEELRRELGPPAVEHGQSDDQWMIFETPAAALRIRCRGSSHPVAASCTATLYTPVATLAEATGALGLWPACEPDVQATAVDAPAVRRAVSGPGGQAYSLMATVRAGRFTGVTVFDEEPEWLHPE